MTATHLLLSVISPRAEQSSERRGEGEYMGDLLGVSAL